MKKQISPLLTLLLLISINIYSQGFWDKVKKGAKEVGTQMVNNSIPETKTVLNMSNVYFRVETSENRLCGKNYVIYSSKDSQILGDNFFSFYENRSCFETSDQYKFINGFYNFLYMINPDGSLLVIREIFPFDEDIKEVIKKNELNDLYCRHYQLIGNDIYIAKYKNKEEMVTNKDKKGELAFQINDNNKTIYSIVENVTFNYSGKNKQELLIMLSSLDYYANDLEFEQKLNRYYKAVADKKHNDNNAKYLTLKKRCNYCNKEYTGVSFDMALYHGKNNGCDKVDEVYHNASCSRKCAFDYCKNQ
jgi:hypothetical protein